MTISSPGRTSRCGLAVAPLPATRANLQAPCASLRVLNRQDTSSQTSRRTFSGISEATLIRVNDEVTLEQLERQWVAALLARDVTTLSALWSDGFIFTDPYGHSLSRDRCLAQI